MFCFYRVPIILTCLGVVFSFPEQTKWADQEINFSSAKTFGSFHAVLSNDTEIRLRIDCYQESEGDNASAPFQFEVKWLLRRSPCSGLYRTIQEKDEESIFNDPEEIFENEEFCEVIGPGLETKNGFHGEKLVSQVLTCGTPVILENLEAKELIRISKPSGVTIDDNSDVSKPNENKGKSESNPETNSAAGSASDSSQRRKRDAASGEVTSNHVIYRTSKSGPFLLLVEVRAVNSNQAVSVGAGATYEVEFVAPHGYLSALDYPMLSFTAVLCVVYALFCIVWMVFGVMHYKNLLRVQFWIGAVIGMGLIEQAVFLAEYEKMNSSGVVLHWVEMVAEFVSILKRTLARCLVLIVSLGYGLVKPRLGSLMNNVVALGMCYFVFALIEAAMRVFQHRNDQSTKALIAVIPLSVTESIICWWVFTSLMTTLKNLKLRRNLVKLTVYRHFFNTLVFGVVAAVVFMIWTVRVHKTPPCVTDWKELWIDDAYWQLLFVVMLFVIIVLWRPSQNNQRYAFSPLMDDEDDEQEEAFIESENANFDQVKIRKNVSHMERTLSRTVDKSEDEHLKWVEENIPTSGFDTALPSLLDSDEEVMTTKLEMSKQQ